MTTLVIVDDDPGFRRAARRLLEAGGFQVVGEAGDVAEARIVVERACPEAVVVDIQLPDGDGFDLVSRIAMSDPAPDVVLVSGRDRTQYGARIDDCGALGFIDKELLSATSLRAVLNRSGR